MSRTSRLERALQSNNLTLDVNRLDLPISLRPRNTGWKQDAVIIFPDSPFTAVETDPQPPLSSNVPRKVYVLWRFCGCVSLARDSLFGGCVESSYFLKVRLN